MSSDEGWGVSSTSSGVLVCIEEERVMGVARPLNRERHW